MFQQGRGGGIDFMIDCFVKKRHPVTVKRVNDKGNQCGTADNGSNCGNNDFAPCFAGTLFLQQSVNIQERILDFFFFHPMGFFHRFRVIFC